MAQQVKLRPLSMNAVDEYLAQAGHLDVDDMNAMIGRIRNKIHEVSRVIDLQVTTMAGEYHTMKCPRMANISRVKRSIKDIVGGSRRDMTLYINNREWTSRDISCHLRGDQSSCTIHLVRMIRMGLD